MKLIQAILIAIVLCSICESGAALKIRSNRSVNTHVTELSPCKAQLDDGSLIDLSSLDNVKNPM